jgi:predicted SAM-dependent methyltransferase
MRCKNMKLNLGCGLDKKQGYINIDIRKEVKPDLIWNLENIPYPFESNSIEEIIAKDVLEHFPFRKVENILKEWFRILKPQGKLYIQTPDLIAICYKVILNNNYTWKDISYWVYGGQDYNENFHKSGFTIPTIRKLLESIGFKIEKIENDGGTNLICHCIKP